MQVCVATIGIVMVAATIACGGGDAGPSGGGDAGAAGSGGSSSGTIVVNGCTVPAGSTVVAAPRVYGDESPFYRIVADDTTVFFSTVDEIWTVDRAGGTPSKIYPPTPELLTVPPFWPRAADVIVSAGAAQLEVIGRSGGPVTATRTLGVGYSASLDGRSDILLDADGNTFYGKQERFGSGGMPSQVTYWTYDFANDMQRALLADSPIGYAKIFVRGGAYLYTAHASVPGPSDDVTPNELYRIPVEGGAAQRVPLTGSFRFNVRGADATHLFLDAQPVPASTTDLGGIYRMPIEGGAPEKLISEFTIFNLLVDIVSQPDRLVIQTFQKFWKVPHGGGAATLLFEIPTKCQVHGFTAHGTDAFIGLLDESNGTMQLVRIPAP